MNKTEKIIRDYEQFLKELTIQAKNGSPLMSPLQIFRNGIVLKSSEILERAEFDVDYVRLETEINKLNEKYLSQFRNV